MTDPIHDYDPAQVLESREANAVFIADALEAGDAAYIAEAMAMVARAGEMIDLDDLRIDIPANALDQIDQELAGDLQGIPAGGP